MRKFKNKQKEAGIGPFKKTVIGEERQAQCDQIWQILKA